MLNIGLLRANLMKTDIVNWFLRFSRQLSPSYHDMHCINILWSIFAAWFFFFNMGMKQYLWWRTIWMFFPSFAVFSLPYCKCHWNYVIESVPKLFFAYSYSVRKLLIIKTKQERREQKTVIKGKNAGYRLDTFQKLFQTDSFYSIIIW